MAIEHKEHFHGSDLEKIEKIYGIKKDEIISFSANVNPLGISEKLRSTLAERLDVITSYPDREYTKLRKVLADYCKTVPENITVGNGSTELISIVIEFRSPKKAMILSPSYSEYEREVKLVGGEIVYFPLKEAENFKLDTAALETALDDGIDMLIICNPNNPTSSCLSQSELRTILKKASQNNILVMIDETYIEFADDQSKLEAIPLTSEFDNLFIIRGISKFFASPGLRLGYAITGNRKLLKEINEKKNPWSINSLAEVAGELIFSDEEYINKTKALISAERKRICSVLDSLSAYGLKYYEPYANFILCKIESTTVNADTLFEACIKKKLMIRNCSTFMYLDERFFRFCIMMPKDNDALLEVIKTELSK
ncbi:MAG: aminotransferase class I/II-fold pyridoxal phosphate-dependent enzyme [Lachnospiraceae bacterium]|nr:aminotransferase class I/II-fold pyridoxal phosphate-dependent enzyme [Lachnospiraceae bacterium]